MSSEKLKDLVKVGDTFFFAPEDARDNHRWLKVCNVTKVGAKFFYINRGYGEDLKCTLNKNPHFSNKGALAQVCVDAGSSVYGYKDEEAYKRQVGLRKLSLQLKQISFFENLPEELKDELYEKLKGYIEN